MMWGRSDSLRPWTSSCSYVSVGQVPTVRSRHFVYKAQRNVIDSRRKPFLRLRLKTSRRIVGAGCRAELRGTENALHSATKTNPLPSSPSSVSEEPSTNHIDVSLLSPMMQHYVLTKREVEHSLESSSDRRFILMYRVGDFFESFFEDAHILSKVCEIALTSKDAGKALGNRVPMAGVPHYCLDDKIKMLLSHNVTVAVVDQVQCSTTVPSGKLVERAVTRLITPGTVCDESLLDGKRSSYIASISIKRFAASRGEGEREQVMNKDSNLVFGFSYADVSTGEFAGTEARGIDALRRLLVTVFPSEVLLMIPSFEKASELLEQEIRSIGVGAVSKRRTVPLETSQRILCGFYGIDDVESLGCRDMPLCAQAAANLLQFVEKTTCVEDEAKGTLLLNKLRPFSLSDTMLLDGACLKNLEVLETARDGIREGSLQWAIDRTTTVMGARCLRSWLVSPPLHLETILQRQRIVESFVKDNGIAAKDVQRILRKVSDLERLGGRLILNRTTPRELQCLCESVLQIPSLLSTAKSCIEEQLPEAGQDPSLQSLLAPVDDELLVLCRKVLDALVDPAPTSVPLHLSSTMGATKEGFATMRARIFRRGYSHVLDGLREKLGNPESWITTVETKEKARTSIDSLRVKHIKNVGYVVRIPRSAGEKIMNEDPTFFKRLGYEQVQSTKIELRFRFEDLRLNEKEFQAGFSQILTLEIGMFEELRVEMRSHLQYMRSLGNRVARLDVLAGLGVVALERHYAKPQLLPQTRHVLEFVDARHPVVEQTMPCGKTYVPNTFHLGQLDNDVHPDMMILCGPNAAGKSCSLRSVGLLAIMAQIGSFVPARYARMSLCDRIFTRVGAVDDLSRGQSTFQVEMAETSCILSHATSSSLVLLDEIGRGTSAVDGIAIAWSVAEFLAQKNSGGALPPRCMFITHYHELNHLSELYSNVQSFHMDVQRGSSTMETNNAGEDSLRIATYNVVSGPSYDSFGIIIAQRAGLPQTVVERAYKIADLLRLPSLKLGSELREGLRRNTETEQESLAFSGETKMMKDGNDYNDVGYSSGFEDGYRAALTEARANVGRVIEQLQAQRDNRRDDKLVF